MEEVVNKSLHNNFECMEIDEDKLEFDLSDHNLLTAQFHFNRGSSRFEKHRTKEINYLKINDVTKQNFLDTVKKELRNRNTPDITIEKYEKIITDAKDSCLMKTMKKKIPKQGNKEDNIWFNKDIEKAIKTRKLYNRQKRNESDHIKKQDLEQKYQKQKREVQKLIKLEVTKHERRITTEIKNDKSHRKLWDTVNTLRGKLRNENKENTLYDLDNKIIENSEYANVINECWQQIYQKHQNDIEEEWSTNKRNQYIHRHEHEIKNGSIVINNINIPAILEEHFDMVEQVHRTNIPSILEEHFDMVEQINCSKAMSKPDITCNELKLHIRKIKNRRAPGPDNIKPDLLKIIGEDDYCIKELTHGMNNILDKKDKLPSTWTESKTVLIPKKNKPTVKDLRPIALTNATYKLFMGILKSKMEKHIREIRQDSEVQAGFTRHRRIADNLFILDYCVATSFKNRKEMYLISVDFAKAFDSIKRSTLIFALKKYKIHPQIIDVIAQIYSNDQTHIYFNNMFQCDIDVTSGIRQGCTGSSNLFLLITYIIIEKLYENLDGLKTNICKIVALFFADDGMIIMQSLKETIDSIKILTDIAQDCGLSINKAKSNILIYNSKEQPDHIEGIPVTNKMNYLGVTVQNKKDCFKLHKEECLNKARHRSNLMPAVIAKSCNKILIGKTYWKNAALPSIMHGTEIVCFTKKQISDLQTEENKAFRYTVNARKCTAISALRGEMGASLQKNRDMKTKILFLRHILTDNNLMKEILIHQLEAKKPTKWIKQIKEYLEELQININTIQTSTIQDIKSTIKIYDSNLWHTDMQEKSTLTIYRKYKHSIKDEQNLYDNSAGTTTLFEARTGTLQLNDTKRHTNGETSCELCGYHYENCEHFLLHCTALQETRKNVIGLQQPFKESIDETISDFLLFKENSEEIINRNRDDLQKLWQHRLKIIHTNVNQNQAVALNQTLDTDHRHRPQTLT